MSPPISCVVLLSGGLDSATVLAMARGAGRRIHALSFDYGQRHGIELESAARVAAAAGASHRVVVVDAEALRGSALTGSGDVPRDSLGADGIPVTYVPGRNTIFLALALGYAEGHGCDEIWIGVNEVDYSGYPDCRPEFIHAFQRLIELGTRSGIERGSPRIVAPLSGMSKAGIIRAGIGLGVDYSMTHSCYDPAPDGAACGHCDSCLLRRKGFEDAAVADPTRYRHER